MVTHNHQHRSDRTRRRAAASTTTTRRRQRQRPTERGPRHPTTPAIHRIEPDQDRVGGGVSCTSPSREHAPVAAPQKARRVRNAEYTFPAYREIVKERLARSRLETKERGPRWGRRVYTAGLTLPIRQALDVGGSSGRRMFHVE
jgi:hypothetical protein